MRQRFLSARQHIDGKYCKEVGSCVCGVHAEVERNFTTTIKYVNEVHMKKKNRTDTVSRQGK